MYPQKFGLIVQIGELPDYSWVVARVECTVRGQHAGKGPEAFGLYMALLEHVN